MVTKDHGTPVFPKKMSAIKRTKNEWPSAVCACKLKLWRVTELQVRSLLPHHFQKQEFLTETGGMNANCHHKACQRASVISSTAKMLLRLVTAFKYQQRRDYKTELIARMATGFIIIQPESRRKWILPDDTENLIQLLTRKQVQCFLGFLRLALAVVLLWLVLLSPLR